MDGKIENVKTISVELKVFDYLAKDSDYISVTEWGNGEGYDININDRQFCLSHGELAAINTLISAIDYNFNIDCND